MRLQRRNNKNSGNHSAEMMHRKAIALIEELDERNRRKIRETANGGGSKSERRMHGLNPKRLLCCSKKAKDYRAEDDLTAQDEACTKRSSHSRSSNNIVEYNTVKEINPNTSHTSALCHGYVDNIMNIDRRHQIVLTTKKAEILDALTNNSSSSSTMDVPLRKFDDDSVGRRVRTTSSLSLDDLQVKRRQPSLLDDDNSTVHTETPSTRNPRNNRISKSRRSKDSKNGRSKNSNNSMSHKNKNNSSRMGPPLLAISISDSTAKKRPPVSFVERNARQGSGSGIVSNVSMVSTMTDSTYSTNLIQDGDGEPVSTAIILSPRGRNDGSDRSLRSRSSTKATADPGHSNTSTALTATLTCSPQICHRRQPQPRVLPSINPDGAHHGMGTAPSNLGIITEGDDSDSFLYSLSSSSDSDHDGGSDGDDGVDDDSSSSSNDSASCSDSIANSEDDDDDDEPSIIYVSEHMRKGKKNSNNTISYLATSTKTNTHRGDRTRGVGAIDQNTAQYWKDVGYEESINSIIQSDMFQDEDQRDDV